MGGVMVMAGAGFAGSSGGAEFGVGTAVAAGAFYLILGAVSFLFGWLLVRYSSAIGRVLLSGLETDLVGALDAQRMLWKVTGISAIAYMAFVLLAAIAIVVVAGVTAAGNF